MGRGHGELMRKLALSLILFCTSLAWARTYSTSFPLTENPISEGGKWVNGGATGLDWTNIRTTANVKAYGSNSGINPGYDDSTAVLQNIGPWGPNQTASGVVFLSSVTNGYDQEVEIRLNTTISAHSITGYSCTFSVRNNGGQYFQVGRWNGPFGNFTLLGTAVIGITPVVNGDTVSCQRVGSVITMYHNGVSINSATDTTYTGGSPGIGTNLDNNGSSTNANFGFSSFSATDGVSSGNIYYISKSLGNDSSTSTQAQSKSTPWQRVPGMASGPSYTPVAGDEFILYGGDSWVAADLPMQINQSGASPCLTTPNSSCIYIGVDQTWYNASVCGASWCRPIFDGGGSGIISYAVVYLYGSYVTLDNIEIKGFGTSGGSGGSYIQLGGAGSQVVENCYLHGWFHGASGDSDTANVISSGSPNNTVHDTIIDGSDTTQDMMVGIQSGIDTVYNSVIQYVTNGLQGTQNNVHDNYIAYIEPCYSGCHQNAFFNFGPNGSATSMFIYNNVIAHVWKPGVGGSGGGLWLSGNNANTATGYAFNNVMFDNQPGFSLSVAGHNPVNYGTWYFFNNTMECGTDTNLCGGSGTVDAGGAAGMTHTFYFGNNHIINSNTNDLNCAYGTCGTPSPLNADLVQLLTTADGQGYTSTSPYAFEPTSGSGSTVGAGGNAQSICTNIAGLNSAAGLACQHDTGYACNYNTSNHAVSCPDRTGNARPATGAWDIGAYLYNGSETTPNPPTNLRGVVN